MFRGRSGFLLARSGDGSRSTRAIVPQRGNRLCPQLHMPRGPSALGAHTRACTLQEFDHWQIVDGLASSGGGAKGVSAWQVVGKSPLPGCVHMARSRSPRSPDAVTDSDRTTGSKGMCIQSGRRPHVCAALVEQTETELGLGVWSFRRRCLDFDKHRPMWSQSAGRCVETTSELLLGVGFERGVGPKAGSLERERERAMFEALPGHNFRVNHGRCVFIEFAYPCPSPVQVQQAARQSAKRFGTSPLWDSVSAVSFAKRILEQRIAPQFCGCARCIQLRPTGF